MAVNIAPVLKQRFFDTNGAPLAGGKLYAYAAGTSTPQDTYTDSTAATPNANPVILDANGEANVWLNVALSYKFVLKNSADATQWTVDNVIGLAANNAVATASLQDLCVTTAKLADDSVTSAKLADDATIDANRAVTTNHLRDGLINRNKMDATTTTNNRQIDNYSITGTVATNLLTAALKTKAGSDASATDYISISFRDSSITSGVYVVRKITASLSVNTVSTGCTFGITPGVAQYIHFYAIDNAGTVVLGLCGSILDENLIYTTTAIGAGSTSPTTLYSTASVTGAIRYLGKFLSNQAVSGTYASAMTEVSACPPVPKQSKAEIRLSSYNGYGATNTKCMRFLVTDINNGGTDLVYVDSVANGAGITALTAGCYAITVGGTGSVTNGISVNTSAGATSSNNVLTYAQGFRAAGNASVPGVLSITLRLNAGDIIRHHTDGTASASVITTFMHVVKVSE